MDTDSYIATNTGPAIDTIGNLQPHTPVQPMDGYALQINKISHLVEYFENRAILRTCANIIYRLDYRVLRSIDIGEQVANVSPNGMRL